jgi:ribonuclease PH
MINKKIERLQRLALKAAMARDKFEAALEKAKQHRNWVAICEERCISPDADAGDWMC